MPAGRYPCLWRMYGPFEWRWPDSGPVVFMTWDDGPHPESTPVLLNLLKGLDVKATFFCLGENAMNYPDLIDQILKNGHTVANHGWSHLDGWRISLRKFKENALKGAHATNSRWFRPPYGRMLPGASYGLRRLGLRVILWDILVQDYHKKISEKSLMAACLHQAREGSIMVWHDTPWALKKTEKILPFIVDTLRNRGFNFSVIPPAPLFPTR
ncbi:MAG: polysaccharide deacetylase family protein [Flavobacteriales bacterium]|nr:polysaccharide deacetylase family protein [Flavobacteriales bacterium]MDW8431543.1 polysaccharide deacetylase family protein [Flavobacteriales bacterium]